MCLAKDETQSPAKEVSPARSPWAKLLNRRSLKPRLPRKVTSSTRVNLNKCWSKLGDLISNSGPRTDLPSNKTAYSEEPLLVPFSNYFYPVEPVKLIQVEDNDNAENQNILNNRFELIESSEVDDNMANEVREICYTTTQHNCRVCKLY
ncbi:Interferon regulatory factor 9 [Operophtera brumata]|uniref:Interferon regulatory factor 9 n=1 Tax=Operophtera brumata TaxID=104452 RepID=A0A0L7LIW5_OPEBR|nr:Interferon regulatory factor 9 [Operophtera brumata]